MYYKNYGILLTFVKQLKEVTIVLLMLWSKNVIMRNGDFEVRNIAHVPLSRTRLAIDTMQEFA